MKLYPGISSTAASRMERIGTHLVECPRCGGSGFEGVGGTGYGDVCSHCGGQKQIQVSGSYARMSQDEQLNFTQQLREARKKGAKAKAVTKGRDNAKQADRDEAATGSSDSESSEHPESENAGG